MTDTAASVSASASASSSIFSSLWSAAASHPYITASSAVVSLGALGLGGWYALTHLTKTERGESDKATTGNGSGAERPEDLPESSQGLTDADRCTIRTNTATLQDLVKRYDAADTERDSARKQAQTAAERAKIAMQAFRELVKVDEELNSYITENRKGDDASQLAWAPLSEAIGHSRTMNMRLFKSKTWKEHQGAINDVPNDRQVYKFAHEEWARQCRGERNAD